MPEFQTITQENRKERERLSALVAGLREGDFQHRLPNGWTVTMALGHLAFWDLRQATLLKRWSQQGVQPGSLDAEAINEPLSVLSASIYPQAVVRLVVEAAETIDHAVEQLTPSQVKDLLKMGLERNLHRALHRREHLDKIEKALRKTAEV
jgi:hypothetical protein